MPRKRVGIGLTKCRRITDEEWAIIQNLRAGRSLQPASTPRPKQRQPKSPKPHPDAPSACPHCGGVLGEFDKGHRTCLNCGAIVKSV